MEMEQGLVDVWRFILPPIENTPLTAIHMLLTQGLIIFLLSRALFLTQKNHQQDNIQVKGVLCSDQFSKPGFSVYLLQDEHSLEFIKNDILDYWLHNESSTSSPAVEWDAFKAVLTGWLIQHCSYLKSKSQILDSRYQKWK